LAIVYVPVVRLAFYDLNYPRITWVVKADEPAVGCDQAKRGSGRSDRAIDRFRAGRLASRYYAVGRAAALVMFRMRALASGIHERPVPSCFRAYSSSLGSILRKKKARE
jgi:hypothetical protein